MFHLVSDQQDIKQPYWGLVLKNVSFLAVQSWGNIFLKPDRRLVKIAQVGKINLADRWTLSLREDQPEEGSLVVEDDREEGPVNRQAVVVVTSVPRLHSRGIGTLLFGNEAQLIELIEKDTDSRPLENPGQRNSYR
ncbi:MAG: hypothetical protein E6K58_06155 [Nitrospirae bacterium]|nr:MAG: hypothetical protein E6K63_12725 [Nitrospirota bacterium]TLY42989.1 MAG: hypothetical protein E6K58_06155 [Nitrospirota bacterium]